MIRSSNNGSKGADDIIEAEASFSGQRHPGKPLQAVGDIHRALHPFISF